MLSVSAAPRAQQLVGVVRGIVHVLESELQESGLLRVGESFELTELLLERLKSADRLAVLLCAPLDLHLNALIGVVAELQILEVGKRQRDRPGSERVETFHRHPEAFGLGREPGIAALAEQLPQSRAL